MTMMSESEVREWRDRERERLNQIMNPYHQKKASDTLHLLNTILGDD